MCVFAYLWIEVVAELATTICWSLCLPFQVSALLDDKLCPEFVEDIVEYAKFHEDHFEKIKVCIAH